MPTEQRFPSARPGATSSSARRGDRAVPAWRLRRFGGSGATLPIGDDPLTLGVGAGCRIQIAGAAERVVLTVTARGRGVRVEPHCDAARIDLDGVPVTGPIRLEGRARTLCVDGVRFALEPIRAGSDGEGADPRTGVPRVPVPQFHKGAVRLAVGAVAVLCVGAFVRAGDDGAGSSGAAHRPLPCTHGDCIAPERMPVPAFAKIESVPGGSVLRGVARTREDCAALDAWRRRGGADSLRDRTVCLPLALEHVTMLVAGSGIQVSDTAQGLRLHGTVDEGVARRMEAIVRESFPDLSLQLEVAAPAPPAARAAEPVASAPGFDADVTRLLGTRLGVMHDGSGRGTLVLADGRLVTSGTEIVPGARVLRIETDHVTVLGGSDDALNYPLQSRIDPAGVRRRPESSSAPSGVVTSATERR